jgi:diamine N-acetyltransferase
MITFGKANLKDSLRISVLLKTVYIQTYATEGVTFEFANFLTQRFSVEHIESTITKSPDQLLIAYYNLNPIGVAEIIYGKTCPIKNIVAPELSKLYILERFYGKGVGYGLMKEVESLVKVGGQKNLWLEVYSRNARAIRFYERQGYISIGNVDFPMENNTYINDVMIKNLFEN